MGYIHVRFYAEPILETEPMPIKTNYTAGPIDDVELTCISTDAETLTFEPRTCKGDTHVFYYKHEGKGIAGSVHITQDDLRELISALQQIADANDRMEEE